MGPMSTTVIDQIHRHASVRDYTDAPISRETVESIISAGQRAATSSNMQAFAVIAVIDPETKSAVAHLCGDQRHIVAAPVFLAWCADLSKLDRAGELRGLPRHHEYVENFLVAAVDAVLAAQNATLAAESLGLGTCYIGGIRNDPLGIVDLLHLPKLMFPITGMTLGWPRKPGTRRPRLPIEGVLHWDHYEAARVDTALLKYDQEMAATGIYNHRQVPAPGRSGQMEEYSWLEHSARRIAQPARAGLREALHEQGFMLE